jgi:hypothetical protein
MEQIIISSGADHERVAHMNPQWSVLDWCWYWERDIRKGYKKAGVVDPGRTMDCGEGCVCKLHD